MEELPRRRADRIIGQKYLYKERVRIWNGTILACEHGTKMNDCKICNGCAHGKIARWCEKCSQCEHGILKYACKICGNRYCEHGRDRSTCRFCGGGKICEHGRVNYDCIECGGIAICKHGKHKKNCIECDGSALCEHGVSKTSCRSCGGSQICSHDIRKYDCMICEPESAFIRTMRSRINSAITGDAQTEDELVELLGCSISDAREYIEAQFTEDMSWSSHGRGNEGWHIDHRRPCASFNLKNEEEMRMCFHFTNLQPLSGKENLRKQAKFDEASFRWIWDGEKWIEIESIN